MLIERVQQIFKEIKDLKIELPRDPAALGPDFLRENIAVCRNYLNTVSYFLQEVMEEAHTLNLTLNDHEAEFQIRSDELLVGDLRVKNLPALEDRLAMINVLLLDDSKAIKSIRREIVSLKQVDKVVRHKKGELDNTMSTLRLQTSLLRDQLRSGLSHGDDSEEARDEARARATSGDDLNLDAILDEVAAVLDQEQSIVQNVDGAEPTKVAVAEEPPVKKGKKEEKPKAVKAPEKSEEDDFLDILDDLIDEGGLDDTPPAKPLPAAKVQSIEGESKKAPQPLKETDIDSDMDRFLNEDSGDDLDALLADI
jgi:hypothetical protein